MSKYWQTRLTLSLLVGTQGLSPSVTLASSVQEQLRVLQRNLSRTQCLMENLNRLGHQDDALGDETLFEHYLLSAAEVDPQASGDQIESLALSLWGQRFLEENPILHRAISEALSAKFTQNGAVDWKGALPEASLQKELDQWIELLSRKKPLSTEEMAKLVDFKNDILFRMDTIVRKLPAPEQSGVYARSQKIQAADADFQFYQKYSASILKSDPNRIGDWLLQSLGEAGANESARQRFRRELKRSGTPDKKLFGDYKYLSPPNGLPQKNRLTPSKELERAIKLLRDQPGTFAILKTEDALTAGTLEQQSFWIEHLLEQAEKGLLPEVSGYTLAQLITRLDSPSDLILRAANLPMAAELRESIEPQLLLLRYRTQKRTAQEIQKALDTYSFNLPDHPKRAPDLQLIHQRSLTEEVWTNPRFAESVRVALPEHLLLLSEAILGALTPQPKSPLEAGKKIQLAYMLNSLLEGRNTLKDKVLRKQLTQNIFLIAEKGELPAPRWLQD